MRISWNTRLLRFACASCLVWMVVGCGEDAHRDDTDTDDDSGTDTDTDSEEDGGPDSGGDPVGDLNLQWVYLEAGDFWMGSEGSMGPQQEKPWHLVDVPQFEMLKTEVTIQQWEVCVLNDACSFPMVDDDDYCNWGLEGVEHHPVTCIIWEQASQFCSWAGGRLPTEAEWEYAAKSMGEYEEFPWGGVEATCDEAVMAIHNYDESTWGCETGRTWPVCGKPEGNSDQGLCDLSGNVWELVQDWYHDSFDGAPTDGSAWDVQQEGYEVYRVVKSGSFQQISEYLRSAYRHGRDYDKGYDDVGFRCARDVL